MAADPFEPYLRDKNPRLREVVRGLRALVREAAPGATEATNPWGLPSFEQDGPLAYLMVGKRHVTFGFQRGAELTDSHGLLEGTGKSLRHVKLRRPEDLQREGLRELVEEAARRNRDEPSAGWMGSRR